MKSVTYRANKTAKESTNLILNLMFMKHMIPKFLIISLSFRADSEAEWKVRGKMYSENVVFFRSVLFPIVQNDSIPTIGHSDIYLFLIPIMSQVGPGSGPSGEVVSYAICVFHTGFTPCPLIPSFQPFLGGGWRRGWMGGCSAWKKCPKCMREKNVQNACVKKMSKMQCVKNVQKYPKCPKRFWLIFDIF